MLEIQNLHAQVQGRPILKGLSLKILPGEIHAIMGPNGAGKSTLSQVLTGHPAYQVTQGKINFKNKNLLDYSPEQRALLGLFLAFQYPVEIPGVNNTYFLKAALNAKRRFQSLPEFDAIDFLKKVKEKMALLKIDDSFLQRNVNEGFSGGEKKRNEALQIALLEPDLCILDETDSGLDIDALKIVAENIRNHHNNQRSLLLITHRPKLLEYLSPDYVHVLQDGKIIESGNHNLAFELEQRGYENPR